MGTDLTALHDCIATREGVRRTFVIEAAHSIESIEQRIAPLFGFESVAALREAGMTLKPLPNGQQTPEGRPSQVTYFALSLPISTRGRLSEAIAPNQLFEIARQIRELGQFQRVDADVPVSYFIPETAENQTRGESVRRYGISQFSFTGGGCNPKQGIDSPPPDWSLSAMRVQEAWALGTRGDGITIAIVDTGWAPHTQVYEAAFDTINDHDFVDDDDDATDPLDPTLKGSLLFPGHGTATASVAVALRPLQRSLLAAWKRAIARAVSRILLSRGSASLPDPVISGVAPNARILPIRFNRSVVAVLGFKLREALDYVIDLKRKNPEAVHIVSISQGCLPFPWIHEAIKHAVEHNLIVVASAGNLPKPVAWPAAFPECIAVAGIGPDLRPWPCTARGGAITISAPAGQVWRATFKEALEPPVRLVPTFEPGSGTSFSAPSVAGVAALWLAHHTPKKLEAICKTKGVTLQALFRALLAETAAIPPHTDRQMWTAEFGAGIVDAAQLLKADPEAVEIAPGRPEHLEPAATIELVSNMVLDSSSGNLRVTFPTLFAGVSEAAVPHTIEAARFSTRQAFARVLGVDEPSIEAYIEAQSAEVLYTLLEHPEIFDNFVHEAVTRSTHGAENRTESLRAEAPDSRLTWLQQAFRDVVGPE